MTEPRLVDVTEIVERLGTLYEPHEIVVFLDEPQPLLDGRTPQSLIDAGRRAEVLALLDRLESGVCL